MKLSQMLDLSNKTPKRKTVDQHRNICVILGILADKLPGPLSIALLTKDTLTYLFNNMVSSTLKILVSHIFYIKRIFKYPIIFFRICKYIHQLYYFH